MPSTPQQEEASRIAGQYDTLRDRVVSGEYSDRLAMSAEQDAAARELLEIFADGLEQSHGPCFAGRGALMDWIDDQFLRLARLDVPDQMAGPMIDAAYLLWQAEAAGLSDNQE